MFRMIGNGNSTGNMHHKLSPLAELIYVYMVAVCSPSCSNSHILPRRAPLTTAPPFSLKLPLKAPTARESGEGSKGYGKEAESRLKQTTSPYTWGSLSMRKFRRFSVCFP